jgi:hypothetical protein
MSDRFSVGYWIGITGVITSALILAYPENTTIHFAMYYWAGSVYACQATFFAWANDVLRYEEDSLRAVVIASMNMGSNAINAWWSIVFYGANFAPYFTRGMWAMIAVSIASKLNYGYVKHNAFDLTFFSGRMDSTSRMATRTHRKEKGERNYLDVTRN